MRAQSLARPGFAGSRGRRATGRSFFSYQSLFVGIVSSFLATVALLLVLGGAFYATPLIERSHHPLYSLLKPSGVVGLSLGIVGTVMMLLIFVYSARKKSKVLQKIGTQAGWLKLHVFLGFAGPVLVTFHTSGKLNGVVAIAFYSMWAIVLSGIVGRYLYAKIPRTMQGNQMTLGEIESELASMVATVRESGQGEAVLRGIERFLGRTHQETGGLIRAVTRVVRDDVTRPISALIVWRIVAADETLGFRKRLGVSRLVLRQQRLLNKLAVLDATKQIFSYWHVFHKPFTVITFSIVLLHVGVAVYFGYGLGW